MKVAGLAIKMKVHHDLNKAAKKFDLKPKKIYRHGESKAI